VEAALQAHIDRGEPIGGTSAGLAVLGDVIFDARHGTVYPEEAAWNAWNYYLTLTDDFLEVLPGVLPDSHFQERGRLGRLVPMLARRIVEHGETGLLGVGVDAYSALTVDAQRRGRVWGESVTFLSATPASVVAAPAGAAPTFTHIRFDMVLHGGLYDLDARQLLETGEALSALDAEEAPSPAGADTLLEGSSEAVRTAGAVQVGGLTGDPDNWWHGDLTISPGDSTLPAAVVVPNVWADSDYYANRVVGAQFALAQHPSLAAVWLDDASRLQVTGGTELAAQGYALVLNGWGATHAGLGSYNQPGLVGATLHALGEGDAVNLAEVYAGVERERRTPAPPPGPAITGVWPNPANAAVSIGLELPTAGPARLRVLDLLGREVGVVPVPPAAAGGSRVQWQAGRLPSGRYLLLLEAEGTRAVRSVTIVK
jgi:hypothetical protein